MNEFDAIAQFVRSFAVSSAPLGPGDDCAVIPWGKRFLCVTTDTCTEGVHFTQRRFTPQDIGHKALAVNLSDLAAMGAKPLWFVCALGLPRGAKPALLKGLSKGMSALAARHNIALVGGNVSRAERLSITLTAAGMAKRPLLRSGAGAGDLLFVSGSLGDAALGLRVLGSRRHLSSQRRQRRPVPKIELGELAARYASAAIDVSDGFLQDLQWVCRASGVGAQVDLEALPQSAPVRALPAGMRRGLLLSGGEDYELLLAVPARSASAFERACRAAGQRVSRVGTFTKAPTLVVGGKVATQASRSGFDHFG